jgi:hypothetical protein
MLIVLSAIGGLVAASLRGGRYVERHLADIENAGQILAGLPRRDGLASGTLSGEMARYRWRLDSEAIQIDFVDSRAPSPWTPRRIVILVQGPRGAPMTIDTVRLVRPGSR